MKPVFTITNSDENSSARTGILHTDHGDISTPCFIPVGTYGAVKTQSSEEIADLPSPILLSNTYHLYLRPGMEILTKAGGIHKFMNFNKVIFTDALFNGQSKTITVDIMSPFKYDDCDTLIIEFSTFSDDTYSYYNSLGDHSEKGELGLFGGEVIPVYSNVENGLGVLISVNAQNIQLKP